MNDKVSKTALIDCVKILAERGRIVRERADDMLHAAARIDTVQPVAALLSIQPKNSNIGGDLWQPQTIRTPILG